MIMKIVKDCFITVIIFFISCALPKEQNKNIVYPKERINGCLYSFIHENKQDNFRYEMFINKICPDYFNIILYAGEGSLNGETPINPNKIPN